MRASALVRIASLLALCASAARAEGLDRDTLLTDSPAVPDQGTFRITGSGTGQGNAADNSSGATGGFSGSIQWTPITNLAADVGGYYQAGDSGPSARIRYQILKQVSAGIDLAAGVRFKTIGFHPDQGEVEFFLAAGRKIGQWDLVLNGVFGVETGGGGGKDVEAKAFGGYRFTDNVRLGIDFRLQAEAGDDDEDTTAKVGRDFDLTTGPALSWMLAKNFQVQALVGVAAPKGSNNTVPVGVISASFDF
jgi:hypothetical protein